MDRAKTKKRINNLDKIRAIVEIAKFDTLQKLAHTDKIRDHHYELANTTKDVLSFARSKYHISSSITKKLKAKGNAKTLWVFITLPSLLIKVSYDQHEKMIMKEFDVNLDDILTVGDPAHTFAKRKMLNEIASYDDLDNSSDGVGAIISNAISKKAYDRILVVANTPKIKSEPWVLFPIDTGDKKEKKSRDKKYKSTKFYYSLSEILENVSTTYITNTIKGIYQESKKFFYKEKLVRHEGSLKTIDARIVLLKSDMNKIHRKSETEEMIHVSQISKRTQKGK